MTVGQLRGGLLRLSSEVSRALGGSPAQLDLLAAKVVLLESTILTHGMPYPENYKMALRVQEIIRERGAIPATVGVISGRVHVGLDNEQLHHLCQSKAADKLKVSRRDIPLALSRGCDGGTTVSGTLAVASSVFPGQSLPLFVTGGIGGVHRAGQNTMDISADLVEMGRCPTMVVSAGVKSILDIGRTLEFLETQGVCVATYGPGDFPAFFSSKSGHKSPHSVNTVREAAEMLRQHRAFALNSGILLGVPIPDSAAEDGEDIETAIQLALKEAEKSGVIGREVTPYVLARVSQLTEGKSLKANLSLIENNADIGAQIAVEASKDGSVLRDFPMAAAAMKKRPTVIGGSNIDLVTR